VGVLNIYDIMLARNAHATRKWRVLKVTPHVATQGAESAVCYCLVIRAIFNDKVVVPYRAGVVVHLEVRLIFRCLRRLRFAEVLGLPLMVLVQLGKEGLVRRLGEHALLFQNGQDTHRLITHTY